jgi:hypothetical protein
VTSNQPLGGKTDHLAQDVGVAGLLHKRAKAHHLIGHRRFLGRLGVSQPDPTGESPVITASHSLATALWRARSASGLFPPSYAAGRERPARTPDQAKPSLMNPFFLDRLFGDVDSRDYAVARDDAIALDATARM